MLRHSIVLFACLSFACSSSTTPPDGGGDAATTMPDGSAHVPFETPIDDARPTASLTAAEVSQFCQVAVASETAARDRLWTFGCKARAGFAPDQASCMDVYSRCVAITSTISFGCASSRPMPSSQPLCNSISVGEAEAGVEAFLTVEIPESIEEICALPSAQRAAIGDLGRLGVSEADIDGFNCAVNSLLTPIGSHPPPELCDDLSFGRSCI